MTAKGTYRLAIAALCVFIVGSCTMPTQPPYPTETPSPTNVVVTPTVPEPTATELAYQNLTGRFVWLVEGSGTMPGTSWLVKGTVVGSQVTLTMTGRFLDKPEDDAPDGGWYVSAAPEFEPAFPSVVEVGACLFQRGYHQRGLTGGNIWWEQVPEDSGNWVLRPKLGLQANENGRIDLAYPFNWEAGDWWSCSITYEAIGA